MEDMFVQAERLLTKIAEEDVNPFSRGTIMEPWTPTFVDVPGIHSQATREIETLIKRVKTEGKSKARLLIGDSATGKSHVLARVRKVFSDRVFFCFSEPLTGNGDNVFRHVLSNIAYSLLRPAPSSPHPQFHRVWRDFFLGAAATRQEHELNFRAWTENRKFDFMLQLDDQLKARGKSVDFMLVGVLYEYARQYRSNPRLRSAAENWCRCVSLNEQESEILDLPSNSSVDTEERAKELIKALGVITSFSRPIFLCFDQVETYLLNDQAFRSFMKIIEYLSEYTYNYAIVTAALLTFDEKLRTSGLTPSTWDRFNSKSKPISIHPLTPEEAQTLLEARLSADMGTLAIRSERPLFPFSAQDLDEILTPPGAVSRTYKQARYVLEDAESIFEEIVASKPTADEIALYFEEHVGLRKRPGEKRQVRQWPDKQAIESYLGGRLKEAFLHYEANHDEVGIDEHRNREIALDLILKAVDRGSGPAECEITNVTLFHRNRREGCDFAMTLSTSDHKVTIGVLFRDDARANVIKSIVRKATAVLRSGAVDRLIYVRDLRATLTPKGRQVLTDFKAEFSGEPPRLLLYGAPTRSLNHLRAMRRLIELAASGDLTMYHSRLKKEHRLNHDDACAYLLDKHRWLENELLASIVSGGHHPRLHGSRTEHGGDPS